ncbi:hypothetical protein Glove_199g151 [Diversispora epigaea]|uniref:Uncharacterized protein n=1 Tax=Diversispora epigaea TaxID=1348612 RepID=A0A397IPU4_9GLOM|nr:hypothetical protein Glove_199g151 [Diversispora epigaea]
MNLHFDIINIEFKSSSQSPLSPSTTTSSSSTEEDESLFNATVNSVLEGHWKEKSHNKSSWN